jgi:hypothetical protein
MFDANQSGRGKAFSFQPAKQAQPSQRPAFSRPNAGNLYGTQRPQIETKTQRPAIQRAPPQTAQRPSTANSRMSGDGASSALFAKSPAKSFDLSSTTPRARAPSNQLALKSSTTYLATPNSGGRGARPSEGKGWINTPKNSAQHGSPPRPNEQAMGRFNKLPSYQGGNMDTGTDDVMQMESMFKQVHQKLQSKDTLLKEKVCGAVVY